jgi:uncharacterized protein YukE
MYRVDLAALAAWAAHVAGLGDEVASGHLASDNLIADAQSGWAGASAIALNITAAAWTRKSRRLLERLGDHASDLTNDAIRLRAIENTRADTLRALG